MNSELEQNLCTWLRSAQDGDAVAYSTFLREVSVLLRGYFRKKISNADFVEDLVQETLLSIHKSRHTYLPDRPVGPWFYAIAQYRMVDFFRNQKRREIVEAIHGEEDAALMEFPSEDGAFDNSVALEQFTSVLALLPEKQMIAVKLHKLEGLSFKEIALRTGISEAAAKVNAHRGYQTLKKAFKGQNED